MKDPFSFAPPSKPAPIRVPLGATAGNLGSGDGFFTSDASPSAHADATGGMMTNMPHAPRAPLAPQYAAAPDPSYPQHFDTFANSAMGQVTMAYGKQAIEGGMARWLPGATALMSSLRMYFAVNNEYVLKKLWVSKFLKDLWEKVSRYGLLPPHLDNPLFYKLYPFPNSISFFHPLFCLC